MIGWEVCAPVCAVGSSLRWRVLLNRALLLVFSLLPLSAYGLTIELNYDYDVNGFFDPQTIEGAKAREALEFAVQAFEPFTDQLLAIQPDGTNSWTARITHPGTGAPNYPVANPEVSAGTLLVFAGAWDLPDTQVGLGGPGGWEAQGTTAFVDVLRNRGQGITKDKYGVAVDFGPWGGALAFDTTGPDGNPRDWHFDVDTRPSAGQTDLLSVAVHELGHTFGFGISDSFYRKIDGDLFTGATVIELNGVAGVPIAPGHWASGTRSPPYDNGPRAAMGASLILGSRVGFSPLDYAGLADTGWEVPSALLGLPGDMDSDLDVDGVDLMRWQRGFGITSGASLVLGDADGDGDVDRYDGWILRRNLGARATTLPGLAQVPEPTTLGLCLSLGLFFFSRRIELADSLDG